MVATLVWLVLVAVFFRWWDVTLRLRLLPFWTATFLGVLLVTTLVTDPRRPWRRGHPLRIRVLVWMGCIVAAAVLPLVVPFVQIGGETLSTAPFGAMLDAVLPVWILAVGIATLWTGMARMWVFLGIAALLGGSLWAFVIRMPGRSWRGPLDPLSAEDAALQLRLAAHVRALAVDIGERSTSRYDATQRAAAYVDGVLTSLGYAVDTQEYRWTDRVYRNLAVELPGRTRTAEIVIVGAHYDTAEEATGADDNASGVAATLELARAFAGAPADRTIRFVLFASEEPPFFATEWMGSFRYARRSREREERVVAMLSLESIGYYDTEPGSQAYPPPFSFFYPNRGDFIGFVGSLSTASLVRRAIGSFRRAARFPSEGVAAPTWIPGITWSDHLGFWQHGYPAVMVTGTAPFRNPFYHTAGDVIETLDLARMTRVVRGLEAVVRDLAGG